jgi:hypothetical protein
LVNTVFRAAGRVKLEFMRWRFESHGEADRLQLRETDRHHITTEDTEVFRTAAAARFIADQEPIGSQMSSRRGVHSA